jgi:hypothetical protein
MKKTVHIVHTRSLLNSASGNPRFFVELSDGTTYNTKKDAACNYGINNPENQGLVEVTIESGFISYIEPVCPHADCGYGECSTNLSRFGPNGCEVHNNGEGRCQEERA